MNAKFEKKSYKLSVSDPPRDVNEGSVKLAKTSKNDNRQWVIVREWSMRASVVPQKVRD